MNDDNISILDLIPTHTRAGKRPMIHERSTTSALRMAFMAHREEDEDMSLCIILHGHLHRAGNL